MTAATASGTAAELLGAGMCSARCLLALASGRCGCRWHGALAGTGVDAGAAPDDQASNHTERTRP